MRTAIYDCYAPDPQPDASIEGQLRVCRARVERAVFELHVGLKGTTGAFYFWDLAQTTRRCPAGKVRVGRDVGTAPEGYALNRSILRLCCQAVGRLRQGPPAEDSVDALETARQLIDRIVIAPPQDDDDQPRIEVIGAFVAMLQVGGLGSSNSKNFAKRTNVICARAHASIVGLGARLSGGVQRQGPCRRFGGGAPVLPYEPRLAHPYRAAGFVAGGVGRFG